MINSTVKAVKGDTIIIPIIALLTQGAGYRAQLRQSGDSQNYFVLSIEDSKIIIPSSQSALLTAGTWFAELEETKTGGVVLTIQKTALFVVDDITQDPDLLPDWVEEGSYRVGEVQLEPEKWRLIGHDGYTPGGIPFTTDIDPRDL